VDFIKKVPSNGPAIIMNYYPLTLYDLIRLENQGKTHLPINLKQKIFYSIILGLELCHLAGFAHLDIKADNILLSP